MGRKQAQAILAAALAWPLAAQEYTPALIPPQIIGSPQTMTPLNGGDDSTRLVQFAFPFEYYGQTFTQAWVSTNGLVSFQGANHLCCNGVPLEQAQRNTIYGLWSDWVSGPNPYYRSNDTGVIFGWYNTQEYGAGGSSTFEIGLFPDGKIQFNYGALSNQYHTLSAGITGPTSTDNIQLFYGQNVQNLQNQSGILLPSAPEPVPVPDAIDPAPDVTPDPTETVEEVLQNEPEPAAEETVIETEMASEAAEETVSEEVIVSDDIVAEQDESQAEDANDEPLSPDQLQALSAIETTAPPTEEEVTQATEAVEQQTEAAEAARVEQQSGPDQTVISEVQRDRNVEFFQREAVEEADLFARETVLQASLQSVAFVAQADAQYTQQYGEQTTTETAGVTYSIQPTEGPTFMPVITTTIGSDTSTPAGQVQQMEILNMTGMQGDMSAGPVIDVGDVNDGDNEAMSQLAAIPAGYSAYTQARVPDAPFYQPRDIYKGRRIPDQNVALYRMMQGQDARWQEMVDAQYE